MSNLDHQPGQVDLEGLLRPYFERITALPLRDEANRKRLKDDKLTDRPGEEVEFADCLIRILDTCAAMGFDIAGAVIEKNRFNQKRADHSMSARVAVGGKRY